MTKEFTNPLLEIAHRAGVDPFIVTRSGVKIHYARIAPRDIYLRDIADHLSCVNRWVGAIGPFSVAQHSVLLAQYAMTADFKQFPQPLKERLRDYEAIVRGDHVLKGNADYLYNAATQDQRLRQAFAKALLMHDAEEYLTNDIPGPLKLVTPGLKEYGNYLRSMIWRKYQIHEDWYKHCKIWDRRILFNEAEWGGKGRSGVTPDRGEGMVSTLDLEIDHAWRPEEASKKFFETFARLI